MPTKKTKKTGKARTLNDLTRADFLAVPSRERYDTDIGPFDSLVILPMSYKHGSGYSCMDFVACRGEEPVCRLSGSSDVVHIGGIGGDDFVRRFYADRGGYAGHALARHTSWSVDCLHKSKLARLFSSGGNGTNWLIAGPSLSSFEVFAAERTEKAEKVDGDKGEVSQP